jgi:hypothetical protein
MPRAMVERVGPFADKANENAQMMLDRALALAEANLITEESLSAEIMKEVIEKRVVRGADARRRRKKWAEIHLSPAKRIEPEPCLRKELLPNKRYEHVERLAQQRRGHHRRDDDKT